MILTFQLRGIRTEAIIGVYPHERHVPQPLVWDLDLTLCEMPAEDSIHATVSYEDIRNWLFEIVRDVQAQLLETLLMQVVERLRLRMDWDRLRLVVHKPHAMPGLDDVAVTIEVGANRRAAHV